MERKVSSENGGKFQVKTLLVCTSFPRRFVFDEPFGWNSLAEVPFTLSSGNETTAHADAVVMWDPDEVDALMIAYSIPAGRVYRAPEMLEDPHFQAREAIIEVETERYGKLKMQGAFPKMSATPSSVRSPAPSIVGQHNAEIYGGLLGMDIAELDRLKAAGAI